MSQSNETNLTPEQRTRLDASRARRRTPEARAEEEAIRDEFRDRPGVSEQLARGEVDEGDLRVPAQLDQLTELIRRFKSIREQRGLSLRQAAGRAGINAEVLSRLENGKNSNPTLDTLYRYAAALGVRLTLGVQEPPGDEQGLSAEEQRKLLLLVSMLGPEEARRRLLALERVG